VIALTEAQRDWAVGAVAALLVIISLIAAFRPRRKNRDN
jgi:hypothetical protein